MTGDAANRMSYSRREFLHSSGLLLACAVGSQRLLLSPAEARAGRVPYEILSAAEAATLESLAEALVPGAAAAGVAHYVDKQLKAPAAESLLMLKYLGVAPADFRDFYTPALGSAASLAQRRYRRSWSELDAAQTQQLLAVLSSGEPEGWTGPAPAFFTFVLRADACDVVYGTQAGFSQLGIPYMAHIEPTEPW